MAKLFLDIAFTHLGAAGEARAQRVPREEGDALLLRQVRAQALMSRATCLSESRSPVAFSPLRLTATKRGPKSILA
jgi:hypothetical protein